ADVPSGSGHFESGVQGFTGGRLLVPVIGSVERCRGFGGWAARAGQAVRAVLGQPASGEAPCQGSGRRAGMVGGALEPVAGATKPLIPGSGVSAEGYPGFGEAAGFLCRAFGWAGT